ncbi:vitamin B12 ABC transporter permease BtuC [Salinarchaeum chitinilyticum]
MHAHRRAATYSTGLLAVLLAVVVASAAIGSVDVPPEHVVKAVINQIAIPTSVGITTTAVGLPFVDAAIPVPTPTATFYEPFSLAVPSTDETIVVDIRLPRVVLAATVGCGLAAAGTVMQGLFRNPLADPSIIGVSTGAAVGAVAAMTLPALVPLGLQPMAFITGLCTAFAVYWIATENGRTPVATLLLAGVAIQALLGAATSYMLITSGDSMEEVVFWLMGNLHAAQWPDLHYTFPIVLLGTLALWAFAADLNVLVMGEEDAHHLGVEVERTKRILLGLATIVTAAGVAVAGVIGFVGLIVPHVLRLLVGPDHRVLVPTSALTGGAFLVAADAISRTTPEAIPVGIVTAVAGGPFFLYLLREREVHGL